MIEWSKFGYPKRLDEDGCVIPCGNTAPWETCDLEDDQKSRGKRGNVVGSAVGNVVDTSLAGVIGGGAPRVDVVVDSAKPGPRDCIVDKGKFVRTFDFSGMRQFDPWEFGKKTVDMAGLQGDGDWKRVCENMLAEKELNVETHCVETHTDIQNCHILDSGTALVILFERFQRVFKSDSGSGFLDGGVLNPEKVPAVLYWSQEKHVAVLTYIKTDLGLLQAELLFADWVQYLVAAKAAYISRGYASLGSSAASGKPPGNKIPGIPSLGLPAAILAPRRGAGGA